MQPVGDVRLWWYFWVTVCLCAWTRTSVAAGDTTTDMSTDTTLGSAYPDDDNHKGEDLSEHTEAFYDQSEHSEEFNPNDGGTTANYGDPSTSPSPGGGTSNTVIPWLMFFCIFSSLCCLLLSLD